MSESSEVRALQEEIVVLRGDLNTKFEAITSELKDLYGKFIITNMQLGQMGIELSGMPEEAKIQMRNEYRERASQARQSLGDDPGFAEAREFLDQILTAYL